MTSAWCWAKKALGVSPGVAECFVFIPAFYLPGGTLSAPSRNIFRQRRLNIVIRVHSCLFVDRLCDLCVLLRLLSLVAALPRWAIRGFLLCAVAWPGGPSEFVALDRRFLSL
jgi:hypothetical protein